MYTVLIAEDELLVRMGLTVSVPWEQLDMAVVSEVSDGQQALDAWRKFRPDILITDLMMPGMDGLSLIRQILSEDDHCAVIVVTCMEQFQALHEAMELGVAAYLVKATMTLENIQSAVRKAKAALGPARGDGAAHRDRAERHTALAGYLLDGNVSLSALYARARAEGWTLPERCAALLVYPHAECDAIPWQLQLSLQNMLRDHLEGERVVCVLKGRKAPVLALMEGFSSALEIERRCDIYRSYFWNNFSIQLAIGACVEPVSLEEMPALVSSLLSMGIECDGRVRWIDAARAPVEPALAEWIASLRRRSWTRNGARWSIEAAKCVARIESVAPGDPLAFGRALRALSACYLQRSSLSESVRRSFDDCLESGGDIRLMIERFEADIAPLCAPYRQEICRVIDHMAENIASTLTLSKLARLIYMHPQYLSNLFRKEVGTSFSDFLSMLRVEQAQRLLQSTSFSLLQVSTACGFSDTAYFCRLFKQKTGVTPGQWRRMPCKS